MLKEIILKKFCLSLFSVTLLVLIVSLFFSGGNMGTFSINSLDYVRVLGLAFLFTFMDMSKSKGCLVYLLGYGSLSFLTRLLKPCAMEIGFFPFLIWTLFLALITVFLFKPWLGLGSGKGRHEK